MRVARTVLDAIIGHARTQAPLECCGLLIGSPEAIEDSVAVDNVRRSRVTFEVDPAGHFAAIRKARRDGRAVVGAYHSHPRSPAVPSETDIREANDATLLHLIVSLAGHDPVVNGYVIEDGRVVRVNLEIE